MPQEKYIRVSAQYIEYMLMELIDPTFNAKTDTIVLHDLTRRHPDDDGTLVIQVIRKRIREPIN